MADGRGGARAGAGRKPGKVAKAKKAIAEDAKKYGPAALKVLNEIMKDADQPANARVSAATALLDRGHGKPTQQVDHGGEVTFKTLADFYAGSDGAADT